MNTFVINDETLKKGWGAEGQYWFSLTDYSIIEDYSLGELRVPENMENDEFFNLHEIIPYFNIKRYELAKAYIFSLNNKKLTAKFEGFKDEEIVEYFWKYFNVYPELFDGFEAFQNEYLINKAKAWCEKNNINYIVK